MANYRLQLNLAKMPETKILQTEDGKRYWAIPFDAQYIYVGKSPWLRLCAWESRSSYYGDTHYVKVDCIQSDEKGSAPIVGNMQEIVFHAKSELAEVSTDEIEEI